MSEVIFYLLKGGYMPRRTIIIESACSSTPTVLCGPTQSFFNNRGPGPEILGILEKKMQTTIIGYNMEVI